MTATATTAEGLAASSRVTSNVATYRASTTLAASTNRQALARRPTSGQGW
jgi:hypothetical protein